MDNIDIFEEPAQVLGPKATGFRFLCQLFAAVSTDPDTQKMLYKCANRLTCVEKDQAVDLVMNWLYFLPRIQSKLKLTEDSSAQYLQLILDDLHKSRNDKKNLNKYCALVPPNFGSLSDQWAEYIKICRRPLVQMFHTQTGATQKYLDFLALSFALSVGTSDNNFRFGKDQIRKVLQLCLQQLGMPIGYLLPQELDDRPQDDDGQYTKLQEYLAVCLDQALYAVYPQRSENLSSCQQKAQQAFQDEYCLIEAEDDPDGLIRELVDRNCSVENLRKEWKLICHRLRTHQTGHFSGYLESMYEVPVFVPVAPETQTGVLCCDEQGSLKRFIYGSQVGKSTFLRIVMLCCMASHPFFSGFIEDDGGAFDSISRTLMLDASCYFPLLLDCRSVGSDCADPVCEAIRQFCRTLDAQSKYLLSYQQKLHHQLVHQLCTQQLMDGQLLLLVDNWDQAPAKLREALYRPDGQLHVLIVSDQCRKSEMRKMSDSYMCWKITGLTSEGKQHLIRKAAKDPSNYQRLLARNRCLDLFADTPARLLMLLSYDGNSWDSMLTREISSQLERLDMPGHSVDHFFHQLARGLLENRWIDPVRNTLDAEFYRDWDVIPGRLPSQALFRNDPFFDHRLANQIWEQACQGQILICAADVPRGFRFKNPMFCYSLAVDAYLELLLEETATDGSVTYSLRRLSPLHFSYVIVLLINRLCGIGPDDYGYRSEHVLDVLHTLCQSIAGYVLSLTDMDDAVHCCWALADILSGQYHENLLSTQINTADFRRKGGVYHSRQILLRSYTYLYHATTYCHAPFELPLPAQLIRSDQETSWFSKYYPQAFEPKHA